MCYGINCEGQFLNIYSSTENRRCTRLHKKVYEGGRVLVSIGHIGASFNEENYGGAERIVKILLWLYGGYKVTVAGYYILIEKRMPSFQPAFVFLSKE